MKNDVALITKLPFYPRTAELLENLPVDVYGVGMPGRTSLALLTKYRKVLYLDDLDPCRIRRYLEWKKLICPEYVGIKVEWLCGTKYDRFRIGNYDQWFLIEKRANPTGVGRGSAVPGGGDDRGAGRCRQRGSGEDSGCRESTHRKAV